MPPRVPDVKPPDAGEVERRARLLFQAMARVGMAAWTPGDRDFDMGPDRLVRMLRRYRIPAVSANVTDRRGKRLFEADRIVTAAGTKVGFFGVTALLPEDREMWARHGIDAGDPIATARVEVESLRRRGARLVVALLHVGSMEKTKELVKAVPGIDVAVLGHSQMNLDTPDVEGQTRIVEAMQLGKNVGRLDLHVIDGGLRFSNRGQRAQILTIRADHQQQIADFRRRAGDDKTGKLKPYFDSRIKALTESVERETKLLASLPEKVEGSWLENRILPLDSAIVDHPAVAMLVADYNAETVRRAADGKPTGIGWPGHPMGGHARPPTAARSDEPLRYAGVVSCGECHASAMTFWQGTKHAVALATLKRKGRDQDPACVGCHVTGYARPGGTTDLALATGRLKDVGCEACHGPGSDHIVADSKKTTTTLKVGVDVCLGCHTPDQTDGDFDYPHFLKAILGPGHGAGS